MNAPQSPAPVAGAVAEAVAWLKSGECNVGPRSEKAIAVVLEALAALPPQPAPEVAVEAERELFEAYIRKDCGDLTTFGRGANVHYLNSAVNNAWLGWQARAALAARSAPAVAESQWISVEDSRPKFVGEEDTPVWTWDGHQVREDNYGLEWDQPAGPVVGGWVVTGEGFQDDTLGTVTHWMPRTPPAPPTAGSGSAQEGQAK